MNAQKLADSTSTTQVGYYQRQGASQFVKFSDNTACKYFIRLFTACCFSISKHFPSFYRP